VITRIARSEVEAALESAPAMLRVKEVAEFARADERTVRRWLASGRLTGVRKSARAYLIPKQSLIRFLSMGVS
jgi:excisionase family DNA binding protein